MTRCRRYAGLFDAYLKRLASSIDIDDFDRMEKLEELMAQMFDTETGEDNLEEKDAQMEAMSPYFTQLEIVSGEKLEKIYGKKIQYGRTIQEQKRFSFQKEGTDYVCYLDGYLEDEEETCVFEVKATSARRFVELGKKLSDQGDVFGRYESIFAFEKNGILRLREEIPLLSDVEKTFPKGKYHAFKQKLFDRYSSAGRYAYDIAIERYFIEQSLEQSGRGNLAPFIKYYLVTLHPDYVLSEGDRSTPPKYDADAEGRELFVLIDMTLVSKEWQPFLENEMRFVESVLKEMSSKPVKIGKHCEHKGTSKCKFIPICWQDFLVIGSILEYRRARYAFKHPVDGYLERFDLLNSGIVRMDQIDEALLTKRSNKIQRDCHVNQSTYINPSKIEAGLKEIRYPVYHLDFETFPCPLPRFRGERPYSQSVFQFSLHIEKEPSLCDKDKDHIEFLAKDHQDRREELIKKLIEAIDLSNGGTVLVYNSSFEKSRLKELSMLFPRYRQQLLTIRDHVFDLMYLVDTNKELYTILGYEEEEASTMNFYDSKLRGSFSIKKVLPLFSDLNYDTLEVGNGTEAILTYAGFPEMTKREREKKVQDLIEYCKQDTWAMVEILKGLRDLLMK